MRLGTPSLEESFIIIKSSLKESGIYRKCSLYFATFFPRIYEINQTQGGAIEYTFERMLPLFENGQCSSLILGGITPIDNLISSIKFTMNCLFNLHLLHKFIGVIHCDISPVNIMYSNVDMIWKFIDFDLSLETSKCKFETSRRVGTRDYIAPESEATGIYSESSDVFSLGSVIFDIVYQDLYRQFVYEDEPPSELLEFESIIVDMYNPLNRISVENALKNLLALLNRLLPQDNEIFNDPIILRVKKFTSLIMEENTNILP
jgi:serine/threonine protein kinase